MKNTLFINLLASSIYSLLATLYLLFLDYHLLQVKLCESEMVYHLILFFIITLLFFVL